VVARGVPESGEGACDSMSKQGRQARILELIAARGEVSVDTLAAELDVSSMTIRRDLTDLAKAGRISRTRGGAVLSATGVAAFEFQQQRRLNLPLKQAIARAAARQVEPGTTLLLDTGSTTLEAARAVAGIPRLTVLTTSLSIASVLYARDNVTLILLGGIVRKGSPDLSGPLTEENLRRFRVDLAMVGADGATQDGVFTAHLEVARVTRSIMAAAQHTLLVADHTKFGTPAFVQYAEWSDIDGIVTDAGMDAATREWVAELGPEVTFAEVDTPA